MEHARILGEEALKRTRSRDVEGVALESKLELGMGEEAIADAHSVAHAVFPANLGGFE